MEEINKQMLLFLAEKNAGENGVTLDPEDQNVMSRATFFRAIKELENDGVLLKVGKAYHLVYRDPLLKMYEQDVALGDAVLELQEAVGRVTRQYFDSLYAHRRFMAAVCSRCENLEDCIKNRRGTCIKYSDFETSPLREKLDKIVELLMKREVGKIPSLVSAETVSAETGIYSREELGSENMQVSAETEQQNLSSLEKKTEEKIKHTPPPPPSSAAVERTEDLRGVMRHILDTSKRPEDEGQKMKAMKKEVWDLWTEGLRGRYGQDFVVGKPVGKDGSLVVQLIAGYGLELTKKIMGVYLGHWDRLKAQNPWVKDTVPTIGMLWHWRQSMVAVATGKATLDVVKRTADEYDEDDRSETRGRWPDREDSEAVAPA